MKRPQLPLLYIILTLGTLFWSFGGMQIDFVQIQNGLPRARQVLAQMFLHPDWSVLPKIVEGLTQSLQIALLGTAIAAILALPFGVLAARNLTRQGVTPLIGKILLNMIRTFPELLLAIAFIKAVGLGPFPGVLAVGIHSIGMIGKLYAERIETVDKGALEALTAVGASPLLIFRHGVIPEVLPDFLSYALYRFDLNVRSASVLGLVGAGGIGMVLDLKNKGGAYSSMGLIILSVILTVICVDFFSAKLRAKLA
jgi:phosphonate transport system permease protein